MAQDKGKGQISQGLEGYGKVLYFFLNVMGNYWWVRQWSYMIEFFTQLL